MKKKFKMAWYYWVLILVVLVAILAAIFGGGDGKRKVAVEKTGTKNITEVVSSNGKLQPEVEVKIAPEVSGEIIGLFVKEGDSVKKGQLLVRINPDLLESDLARTNANLNNSKANLENAKARLAQLQARLTAELEPAYKRNQKLYADKVISDAEFEIAKSVYQAALKDIDAAKATVNASRYSVQSAEALLSQSSKNLLRTEIYATMDGIISLLNVKQGERVVGTATMAGTELLRIADLSQMEMQVDVSENDIIRVAIGDTATIEVDAYPGEKFKGIVKEVANSATTSGVSSTDQVTNFEVKIRVLRESYAELMKGKSIRLSPFRPGMSGTADIATDLQKGVISVPIEAVTTRSPKKDKDKGEDDKKGKKGKDDDDKDEQPSYTQKEEGKYEKKEVVFVYSEGKVKMVEVETGIQDSKYIQIIKGLKKGDEVVVSPYSAISKDLKDGTEVEVTDKKLLFSRKK